VSAAIAAGHPATVAAGLEILQAGGTAADAAVGASLASCVAETVMTGFLGGGHAIHYDARSGVAENLDCFVAVPGLGAEAREIQLLELDVPFGAELVHYAVGPASCGVPGVPAGLDELWRRHGRLDWPTLVEPAMRLARSGVEMAPAHAACLAMLAPVMTMNDGARIYSPNGFLLQAGGRLDQPGLVRALELILEEGPGSFYTGTLAERLLAAMDELGGVVTRDDLETYRALWSEPVEVEYLDWTVQSRSDLSGVPEALSRLPRLADVDEPERAVSVAEALHGAAVGDAHTTNISVLDAEGNACVLTTSLGLGSGDFLPGLDMHLNSMLGEVDLLPGGNGGRPGERMNSMMAPTLAFRDGAFDLAIGAAGGTRLGGALVQVSESLLDEGLRPEAAVARHRLHPVAGRVQLEPGFSAQAIAALEQAGFEPRVWPAKHHFFGGVSLVTPSGAAGDPRRSGGAARVQ
jgi:gamma-glutamyltranspeptidase / glutathione hydrolase